MMMAHRMKHFQIKSFDCDNSCQVSYVSILFLFPTLSFVTLPNFLANQALIPELIQEKASVDSIVNAIHPMLKESPANQFLTEAQKIYDSLAGDVSGRAAEVILEHLS